MAYTSLRLNGTIKPYIEESKTSTTVARNGGATVGDCGADVPNGHSNGHVIRGSAQDKHSAVVPTLTKRISRRVYAAKPSLINELVENDSNFRSLHILISTQIVLFLLYNFLWDSYKAGRPHVNLHGIMDKIGGLADIGYFLLVEFIVHLSAFAVHPFFKGWMFTRQHLPHAVVDVFFFLLYSGAVLGSFPAIAYSCDAVSLPAFLSVAISVEQVRVCMKSYSFIRENAYKILYPWHKDDKSGPAVWYAGQMSPTVGSFHQYCYYLLCPALLYRDHYPRISGPIRWKKAGLHLIYFCTGIWCNYLVAVTFLMPDDLSYESVFKCFFRCVIFGLPSLVLSHIISIHGWPNFGAELTRLADRQFYSDWWSSTHFSEYYRKWNLLVHEYIHQYLYNDVKYLIPQKQVRAFLSIVLSALLHEYFIFMGTGFYSPILIINFSVVGFIFFVWPVKHPLARNWLTMFALSIGQGLMAALYILEVFARKSCKDESHDFFGLRMFHCILKSNM